MKGLVGDRGPDGPLGQKVLPVGCPVLAILLAWARQAVAARPPPPPPPPARPPPWALWGLGMLGLLPSLQEKGLRWGWG